MLSLKSELQKRGAAVLVRESEMFVGERKKTGENDEFQPSQNQWKALLLLQKGDGWVVSLWNTNGRMPKTLTAAAEGSSLPSAFTGMCPWLTASSLAYIKNISKRRRGHTHTDKHTHSCDLKMAAWKFFYLFYPFSKKKEMKPIEKYGATWWPKWKVSYSSYVYKDTSKRKKKKTMEYPRLPVLHL